MNVAIGVLINNNILAHKSYDKWLLDGGIELQLPGFRLTNLQMFWLANANVYGLKSHKLSEKHLKIQAVLRNKYFHVHFKVNPDFRKDFNCGGVTEAEMKLLEEYYEKLRENF